MYLAKKEIDGKLNYFIRETYEEDGELKSRTLFDLGSDPAQYIKYPGGNSYYINQQIELGIAEKGFEIDSFELEDLFWPFVDERLKRTIERFGGPKSNRNSRHLLSKSELMELQAGIHIFDKRRLHFLKFGVIDQKDIESFPYRFYNRLLAKSRDEIECYIDEAESCLKSGELKSYVYAIFDLRKYFHGSRAAKTSPGALDQEMLDNRFLEEVCALNCDRTFFGNHHAPKRLDDYLVKYVILYFDNRYSEDISFEEFIQGLNRDRYYHAPRSRKPECTVSEACRILCIPEADYARMTRKQIKKIFSTLAHRHHPDKGGAKEEFISLLEAYKKLIGGK